VTGKLTEGEQRLECRDAAAGDENPEAISMPSTHPSLRYEERGVGMAVEVVVMDVVAPWARGEALSIVDRK
jgi:hypothetical protein